MAIEIGDQIIEQNSPVLVDLFYPRTDKYCSIIEVGLCDVRAADNIRISYDFDRDGWVIKQFNHDAYKNDDTQSDDNYWLEVSFIKAWDLETWDLETE